MDANASGKIRKDWLTFHGADYLATKIILGIAAVGSILFSLGGPVVDAATNAPLPVSYMTKVTSGIELPRGATHDGFVTVELLLKDATFGERFDQALPGLLFTGLTVAVAWMLFQLLRSTQAGEPFTRRNVRRINSTAVIVGLGGVLVPFAQGFADSSFNMTGRLPGPPTLTFEISLTPWPLVAMLVIALIGEVFRRGVELRDDVEGLV